MSTRADNIKFYTQDCLSDDLRESVAAQLRLLTGEQLSLNEEVAINRERCKDLTREWSRTRKLVKVAEERLSKDPHNVTLQELLRACNAQAYEAGERMAKTMAAQKDMVSAAVVADARTKETLTQNTLMLLISAVLDLAHERFNDGSAAAIAEMASFEDELRTRVVFQEVDERELAIEYQFEAMLESIPGPPGETQPQQLLEG